MSIFQSYKHFTELSSFWTVVSISRIVNIFQSYEFLYSCEHISESTFSLALCYWSTTLMVIVLLYNTWTRPAWAPSQAW